MHRYQITGHFQRTVMFPQQAQQGMERQPVKQFSSASDEHRHKVAIDIHKALIQSVKA